MTIDTPFLQHVAFCTCLIIAFAFILGAFKSKKKKRSIPTAQWDIESYYMYVKALIASSLTLEQLYANQLSIKGFLSKSFGKPVTHKERVKYYNRIIGVYTQKERELHFSELNPRNLIMSSQP